MFKRKLSSFCAVIASAAALLSSCLGAPVENGQRFPTSQDFPPHVMERFSYVAGVPEGWRLSALRTPPREGARWRVLVISGTPSWSEYWAPTIAAAPDWMEMIVVDRPGFRMSEPSEAVTDLSRQAAAMAPLLDAPEDRPVLIVGQSFGAPIATLMAAARPDRVQGIVLVSGYFGDRGPTARRLFGLGQIVRPLLPHDLRNSVREVGAQRPQLPAVREALTGLTIPVTFIHGERDTFVPFAAARSLAEEEEAAFVPVAVGDHFLNACCVPDLLSAFEATIARAERATAQNVPPALP